MLSHDELDEMQGELNGEDQPTLVCECDLSIKHDVNRVEGHFCEVCDSEIHEELNPHCNK